MAILFIVNNPKNWPLRIPGVELVAARSYLTDPRYSEGGRKVFNLCRDYSYQSLGYYVSLLAAARGHKPLPSISTIQDMKSQTLMRLHSDELDPLIQRSLHPIHSDRFALSIYFGHSLARRHDRLALQIFNLFPAPMLHARFVRREDGWELQDVDPMAASEVPQEHRSFVAEKAAEYFAGKRGAPGRRKVPRYDLAILYSRAESDPPSDERALHRFMRAAESLGMGTDVIDQDDYGRVAEYDALFIRETTAVNHHTFRFARRAAAEGLVVVDDPESILKCTNKVYLAELLNRHKIPTPKTLIVHRDNLDTIERELGLPFVLKQPDSSFSQGVVKVCERAEVEPAVERLLERSEMVIAQSYVPTSFDWRVGVFDRQPLYVCRYYMASRHWQIIRRDARGKFRFGRVETLAVEDAPRAVVRTALRAANLFGDGLYGVDIKQSGGRFYVVEVNDNPSIDAGYEDAVLKDELYLRIMRVFLERIERRKTVASA